MTLHKDLTDPQLHEPKGASTATSGTVYVADGAGSGSFQAYPSASTSTRGIVFQAATDADITDSTGGTASSTLSSITAGAAYAQADMTAVKNAIASLAAEINDLRAKLRTAGVLST